MSGQDYTLPFPPLFLPSSRANALCVLVTAQRKSSIPIGGELSPTFASKSRYGLTSSFFSILARTELRGSCGRDEF